MSQNFLPDDNVLLWHSLEADSLTWVHHYNGNKFF